MQYYILHAWLLDRDVLLLRGLLRSGQRLLRRHVRLALAISGLLLRLMKLQQLFLQPLEQVFRVAFRLGFHIGAHSLFVSVYYSVRLQWLRGLLLLHDELLRLRLGVERRCLRLP